MPTRIYGLRLCVSLCIFCILGIRRHIHDKCALHVIWMHVCVCVFVVFVGIFLPLSSHLISSPFASPSQLNSAQLCSVHIKLIRFNVPINFSTSQCHLFVPTCDSLRGKIEKKNSSYAHITEMAYTEC